MNVLSTVIEGFLACYNCLLISLMLHLLVPDYINEKTAMSNQLYIAVFYSIYIEYGCLILPVSIR